MSVRDASSDEPGPGHGVGPLERGLEAGYEYAQARRGDQARLKAIARARSVSDVTASVDSAELASEVGDPHAFWSGFAHGVAKFLVEESRIIE